MLAKKMRKYASRTPCHAAQGADQEGQRMSAAVSSTAAELDLRHCEITAADTRSRWQISEIARMDVMIAEALFPHALM